MRTEEHGHFPRTGNGQELCSAQIQWARVGAVEARGEQFHGPAFDRMTINDGLPVGREARSHNRSSAERKPMEARRRIATVTEAQNICTGASKHQRQYSQGGNQPGTRTNGNWMNAALGGAGNVGQGLQSESDITG